MDSNQSGYELHHHDLHLKALFTVLQLSQQFLWEILIRRDICWFSALEPVAHMRWGSLFVSSPWGSWIRWIAEKLNVTGFFFFLCFCPMRVRTRGSIHLNTNGTVRAPPLQRLQQGYLEDFHGLLQLLLVLAVFLASGVPHLQVSDRRSLRLKEPRDTTT